MNKLISCSSKKVSYDIKAIIQCFSKENLDFLDVIFPKIFIKALISITNNFALGDLHKLGYTRKLYQFEQYSLFDDQNDCNGFSKNQQKILSILKPFLNTKQFTLLLEDLELYKNKIDAIKILDKVQFLNYVDNVFETLNGDFKEASRWIFELYKDVFIYELMKDPMNFFYLEFTQGKLFCGKTIKTFIEDHFSDFIHYTVIQKRQFDIKFFLKDSDSCRTTHTLFTLSLAFFITKLTGLQDQFNFLKCKYKDKYDTYLNQFTFSEQFNFQFEMESFFLEKLYRS